MKAGTLLAANAKRYPERAAVICGDRRLSFRELDALTNQIADALLSKASKSATGLPSACPTASN